ncbi:MAG TPA: PAS domain S-box protein, partial [Solirubrobacteraceae bacterium]|nr:PAS domain S-box protein [Solirubrobacteraceae bacterium]
MSLSSRNPLDGLSAGEIALSVLRTLPAASALVFDRELCFVLAGGHALENEGLTSGELEGRPAVEVLVGERWETYEPLYRSALNGETRSLEIWSADDTRCYQVEVGPLRGEGEEIVGGVAISRDITPRKHAEEARRHAQERFELVFEQAPIGMALLTPEGRWVRVNQALLAITGYSSEELLAKTLEEITHPDDLSADLENVRRLLAGEIRHYAMERRYF